MGIGSNVAADKAPREGEHLLDQNRRLQNRSTTIMTEQSYWHV